MNISIPASGPRIIQLDQLSDEPAGGKSEGLARLMGLGLRVPPGFVIIGASPGNLPDSLETAYHALGSTPVAVRSSALGEDSDQFSFAGQYATILDVKSLDELRDAVNQCLDSVNNPRAQVYRNDLYNPLDVRMSVVVQEMINPRTAGVLFTTDPTNPQREHIVVEAVEGIGEALVSGQATPDRYMLSRSGQLEGQTLQGFAALLAETELRQLVRDSLEAESYFGYPLDMEWAISSDGKLYWLQARPITMLDMPDVYELDTYVREPDDVFTSANIGEILPGAITPLTWSVFGEAMEYAFRDMYARIGVYTETDAETSYVNMFGGHLFLNLTKMYIICAEVLGTSKADLDLSIVGRVLPDSKIEPPAPLTRRMMNGWRYISFMTGARKRVEELTRQVEKFRLPATATASEQLALIEKHLPQLDQAWAVHLASSSGSGALHGVLVRILSKGRIATAQHHAEAASLLVDIEHIESAEVIESLECITAQLEADGTADQTFLILSPQDALDWLYSPSSGESGILFRKFLVDHGHRCFREAELRQSDWSEDPLSLMTTLQSPVVNHQASPARTTEEVTTKQPDLTLSQFNWVGSRLIKFVLPGAKSAIRQRERTKSLCIKITSEFKRAFGDLARKLVEAGRLPDTDAIFFLTLDQVAQVVHESHPELIKLAMWRRRLLYQQMRLEYLDVYTGRPKPQILEPGGIKQGDSLSGIPVSRGTAIGPARIVRRLEDATELRSGEILIVPYTDVGWTPYFSLAAGLASDIGSPISHGAVVAREYGLPTVVNLRTATRSLNTGDLVVLNGDNGTLQRVESNRIDLIHSDQ